LTFLLIRAPCAKRQAKTEHIGLAVEQPSLTSVISAFSSVV
jgi:hypothetical protein